MLSTNRVALIAIIFAAAVAPAYAQTREQDRAAQHPGTELWQPAQPPAEPSQGPAVGSGPGNMRGGYGTAGSRYGSMGSGYGGMMGGGMMGGGWTTR